MKKTILVIFFAGLCFCVYAQEAGRRSAIIREISGKVELKSSSSGGLYSGNDWGHYHGRHYCIHRFKEHGAFGSWKRVYFCNARYPS